MKRGSTAHTWHWQRTHMYGRQGRAEHRALRTRHGGEQPVYSRKMRDLINRLLRTGR